MRLCTGMSETEKTVLLAGQKKCVSGVSVLLPKSLIVTLKIYVNDQNVPHCLRVKRPIPVRSYPDTNRYIQIPQ